MDPLYRACGHFMWEEEEENVKGNSSVCVCVCVCDGIILRLPVSCCFGTADFEIECDHCIAVLEKEGRKKLDSSAKCLKYLLSPSPFTN